MIINPVIVQSKVGQEYFRRLQPYILCEASFKLCCENFERGCLCRVIFSIKFVFGDCWKELSNFFDKLKALDRKVDTTAQ
jgi:hypothetical protein